MFTSWKQRRKAAVPSVRQLEATLASKLKNAPAINLIDEAKWLELLQSNAGSPYGQDIMRYAENWARLMQVEIATGQTVAAVADKTSEVADVMYLSGAQFSFAVHALSVTWRYGDELKLAMAR